MEQNKEKFVTDVLSYKNYYYLAENDGVKYGKKKELDPKDLFLCLLKIRHREKKR